MLGIEPRYVVTEYCTYKLQSHKISNIISTRNIIHISNLLSIYIINEYFCVHYVLSIYKNEKLKEFGFKPGPGVVKNAILALAITWYLVGY